MIGTFWNICRACPSVPVDKLHSEYRSTYRWHEYGEPRTQVIRRPPQGFVSGQVQEPDFPRRKKYPDIAYKTHQFLSDTGSETFSVSPNRTRSEERWASSREKNSRRSKSEGRHADNSSTRSISRNINTGTSIKPIIPPPRSCTFIKTKDSYINDENKVPVTTTKPFGTRYNIRQNELSLRGQEDDINTRQPLSNSRINEFTLENSPKKFDSMNEMKNREAGYSRETAAVHRKTEDLKTTQINKSDTENYNMNNCGQRYQDDTEGEPKSEYKKNFQPFNRYEYDEERGTFEKKSTPITYNTSTETDSKPLSSWYREVVLLRQKANQYRHRGWGTELIPEHIAQLYNDQMMVWEQVSRRSTLSALALATTVNCRDQSLSKEEKENRKSSPGKSLTRARSAKAAAQPTATHQVKQDKKKITKSGKSQAESSPKKGNNQVKKLEIKRTSPNRTSRESGTGTPPTVHKSLNPCSEKPKRRPRPTSLIATVPSGSKTAQSKIKGTKDGETDDFSSLGHEHIVKSPPEPTRVKSPEQIVIRSPEPVNWTVPLDTGKTFTVTQNIREGDLAPRSYSEVRAWTPNSGPQPPASVSAPTELRDITKANVRKEMLIE